MRWEVDVLDFKCTCAYMVQRRIPCCHLIAALKFVGSFDKVYDAFGDEYKVSTYCDAYQGMSVKLPVDIEDIVDTSMLPSKCVKKRKRGPAAVVRKRSKGE
jgi:hypothetical protein